MQVPLGLLLTIFFVNSKRTNPRHKQAPDIYTRLKMIQENLVQNNIHPHSLEECSHSELPHTEECSLIFKTEKGQDQRHNYCLMIIGAYVVLLVLTIIN